MSHDLIAELAGYRAELAGAEQYGKKERAAAVRAEIERVERAIRARVEQLNAQADNHEAELEDLSAAKARVAARELQAALPEQTADKKAAPAKAAPAKGASA